MEIKLRDIFHLPQLKDLKTVAGSRGLERTLHWVHVVELPDVMHWTLGGELIFMTGIGIRDNLPLLSRIVEECARKNVAGLVLNVGPYIPATPPEVVQLGDNLGFPIFELPWEVKLVEVTKEICNHIMTRQVEEKSIQDIIENILYGDCSDSELLMTRAALYDYDLGKPHRGMIALCSRKVCVQQANLSMERQVLEDKLRFSQIIQEVFQRFNQKVLYTTRSDRTFLLLPSDGCMQEEKRIESVVQTLLQCTSEQLKNSNVFIGWGNAFECLREFKKSMEQAELALKVSLTSGKRLYFGYNTLGFYKVLFNVSNRKELEKFRSEILTPLHAYDQRHQGELLSTLTAFLESNDNLANVAEKLHIHRNTLRYRLQKVEELTGRDLGDTQDRMHLFFATVVDKYLSL